MRLRNDSEWYWLSYARLIRAGHRYGRICRLEEIHEALPDGAVNETCNSASGGQMGNGDSHVREDA